jgi:ketosteroid isomerase-like protein
MKTLFLSFWIAVLFFDCTGQEPSKMNAQDQETAKIEIREIVNQIFKSANNLDLESLFKYYSDTPDFLLVHLDGSLLDFQGAKKVTGETVNALSFVNYSIIKDEFRFLPNNIIICAWNGKCEMTLKTGEKMKIEKIGITFIFKKIDNQWKVIYSHRSASPRVQL